jgi:GNAT superfamily N-acetyltransferase
MLTAPEIRTLTGTDADTAWTLSTTAGWNQRPTDWRMLIRLAPAGSFGAIVDGRIVGTAIGIDYGGFGWIAMMLVEPAYRGQGIGARLLESAMSAIPPEVPIRLDATPMGRPLYERYGFREETVLTRHVSHPDTRRPFRPAGPSTLRARAMTRADLDAVEHVDRGVFGGNRLPVLEWMLEGGPQYAQIVDGPAPHAYCFGRNGRLFDQIGPVVSDDETAACALVGAMPTRRDLVVDAFDAQTGFTRWLHDCGFVAQRPLFRMCRPAAGGAGPPEKNVPPGVREFAILGPEFG